MQMYITDIYHADYDYYVQLIAKKQILEIKAVQGIIQFI